jgi:asparagine synthase (glutamine-hydrolysing)
VANIGNILGSEARTFKALTLSNEDFDGDESELARATAQNASVSWAKIEPKKEEAAKDIWHLIRGMDEPFPSLSMLGQRKVMQYARHLGLKVMLDGQGGDEVFLGYPRVAMRVVSENLYSRKLSSALREWSGLRRNASQQSAQILLNNTFFSSPSLVHWRNKKRTAGLVDEDFLGEARHEVAETMYGDHQTVLDLQVGELTRFGVWR